VALPATDNFNRSNQLGLGSNWTPTINNFQVVNNAAQGNNFAYNADTWSADAFSGNHYAQCVCGAGSGALSDGGPGVRMQTGPKSYHFDTKGGAGNSKIQMDIAGSFTDLVTGLTVATGDTAYIEASGSTLTAKVNGTQVGQTTESSITGGAAGLWSYDTTGNYDDFQADNLGGGFDPSTVPWQVQVSDMPSLALVGF
jgi:hypothetical protein